MWSTFKGSPHHDHSIKFFFTQLYKPRRSIQRAANHLLTLSVVLKLLLQWVLPRSPQLEVIPEQTLWDDPESKSRNQPKRTTENSRTGRFVKKLKVFTSFQPAVEKTSSTHLFHSEGSSSCRSMFISSNTFWAFTNSSSALITEKGESKLQHRQVFQRAGIIVTLDFSWRTSKILGWGNPHSKRISQEQELHH